MSSVCKLVYGISKRWPLFSCYKNLDNFITSTQMVLPLGHFIYFIKNILAKIDSLSL